MSISGKNLVSLVLLALIIIIGALTFTGSAALGGEPKLDVKVHHKEQIISAAYKVYGRPSLKFWVAKTVLRNIGDVPVRNVKVSYYIEGYTSWSTPTKYDEIPPGGAVVDTYYPKLPKKVAELTSPVPTKLYVKITYEKNGRTEEIIQSKDIEFLGVHDIVYSSIPAEESLLSFPDVFSNSPLLAAWVTPTDPVVREFSDLGNKLAGGAGASLSDEEALKTMQGIWQALLIRGITYKTEPEGFWTGKFAQYVKFPRDTILDGEGTCIDLAIMYASLVAAQGLTDVYIMMVPGHAFPIVRLPKSGSMIPIETTTLNQGATFKQAVQTAVYNWQQKFSKGPYIPINVKAWQASGVTPPELPPLPSDILERKGIKQKIMAVISKLGGELRTYSNNYFSIRYPASWSEDSGTDDEGSYVSWTYPEDEGMILYVSWTSFQGSLGDYISYIESLYDEQRMGMQQGQIGSCPYVVASYAWEYEGQPWMSNEIYLLCGGAGIHLSFQAEKRYWDDGTASTVWERVASSFYPMIAGG